MPIPSKQYIEGFLDGCFWLKKAMLGEEPDNDFIRNLKKIIAEEMAFIEERMERHRFHHIERYMGLIDEHDWSFIEEESLSTDPKS